VAFSLIEPEEDPSRLILDVSLLTCDEEKQLVIRESCVELQTHTSLSYTHTLKLTYSRITVGPFKTRIIGPKDLEMDDAKKFDYSVDMSNSEMKDLPGIVLSGGVKAAGQAVGLLREVLDAIDLFVGKSLVLWATAYIGFKFLHFKIFPDFPPF
jgi:hypothetical protein